MKYKSQKVYFSTYTDGTEGLTYTLSLDNDYDILVFDQQNNLISSLPIKIEATVLANGDALNEKEYGTFSLSIEGSIWEEGEHYNFDKENGVLQINKAPVGFKEASFKFSWTRKEDEKPILSKTFSLKKNISNTDLSLLVEKTVVNSSQKGGRIGIWIVCKDINGIIELDPGQVERTYIQVNGEKYEIEEGDDRVVIYYEQGHTDPITITLRENSDNFLWDTETIEFVQDGEKGDEALVYNGSLKIAGNVGDTVNLTSSNFNRIPQPKETFYVMCNGRYFVKFQVEGIEGSVICKIVEKNDLTGPQGESGKDGSNVRYIYYRCSEINAPESDALKGCNGGTAEADLPYGWYDSPQGITLNEPYEYVSISTKPAGTNTSWSSFSTPVIWSKWGEKGQDGDGVEYEFYLSDSSSPPANYSDVLWTSDPSGVTKEKPYEYVVKIKITHNPDGSVTKEPGSISLWGKWGEKGDKGDTVGAMYIYAGTIDPEPPDLPARETNGIEPWGKWPIDAYDRQPYIWVSQGTYKEVDGVRTYEHDWSTPELHSAWLAGNVSGEKAATFYKLFGYGAKNEQGIKYDDSGNAYINASMIKTGTLVVSEDNKPIFSADVDEGSVMMGGWTVKNGLLASDDQQIFLSPNGTNTNNVVFKAGTKFKVTKDGTLHADNAKIIGEIVATRLELRGDALEGVDIELPDNIITTDAVIEDKYIYVTKEDTYTAPDFGTYTVAVRLEDGQELMNVELIDVYVEYEDGGTYSMHGSTVTNIDSVTNTFVINIPEEDGIYDPSTDSIRVEYLCTYRKERDGESSTSFLVSSDGLLTAKNAIISGTIYASAGLVGGWKISEKSITTSGAGMSSDNAVRFYGGAQPAIEETRITYKNQTLNTWAVSGSFTLPNCEYITSVYASCSNGGIVEINTPLPANTDTIEYSYYRLGGNATTCQLDFDCKYIKKGQIKFAVFENGSMHATDARITGGSVILTDDDDKWVELGTGGGLRVLDINRDSKGTGQGFDRYACAQYSADVVRYGYTTAFNDGKITNTNSWNYHWMSNDPYISVDGRWVGNESGSIVSDANLKNNIEYLDNKYDIFFDNLISRRFKYNHGTGNRYHLGYITQEVQKSLSEANIDEKEFAAICTFNKGLEDEFSALRYEEFIALNTWQIQKLKPRVSSLEQTILNYESRISALENEIQNLKKS